jgi:hypothetical protein
MNIGLVISLLKRSCCCEKGDNEVPVTCNDGMDIVFLVDYTGSMGGAINEVKNSIASIVATILNESSSNYRLGLVLFDEVSSSSSPTYNTSQAYTTLPSSQKYINPGLAGQFGPVTQYITAMEILSQNNQTSFINNLNLLNTSNFPLGSGLGIPEPSDMGIDRIVNFDLVGAFRENVEKLIILITDAPPSGNDDTNNQVDANFAQTILADCLGKGVKVLLMKNNSSSKEPLETVAIGSGGLVSDSFTPEAINIAIEDICIVE